MREVFLALSATAAIRQSDCAADATYELQLYDVHMSGLHGDDCFQLDFFEREWLFSEKQNNM